MRPLMLLGLVCGQLALRVGCDGVETRPLAPCVEDGGATGGGSAGGTATAAGGGTGGTGGSASAGGGAAGGAAGAPNTIPLDELCEVVLTGVYRLQSGTLSRSCIAGVTPADVPHLPAAGATQYGLPVLGDGLQILTCDGGVHLPLYFVATFSANNSIPLPTSSPLRDMLASLYAAIDAGRLAYDPAKAWQCRELGRALTDAGFVDVPDASVCDTMLIGLVPLGGACNEGDECAGDAFCRPSGATSCGGTCRARLVDGTACDPDRDVCVGECFDPGGGYRCGPTRDPPLILPIGSPCNRSSIDAGCVATAFCVVDGGMDGVCTARALTGQPCGPGGNGLPPCLDDCENCDTPDGGVLRCLSASPGSVCDSDNDCLNGTFCDQGICTFRAKPGQTCVTDGYGELGSCLWGDTFCRLATGDAGTGTCASLPSLGQSCGSTFALSPLCLGQAYCDLSGTCRAPPGLNQPCGLGPLPEPFCEVGLWCSDAGTVLRCVDFPGPGQPCAPGPLCAAGSYCDVSDVCRYRKAAGAACNDSNECDGGLCSVVTSTCSTACNTDDNESQNASCTCVGRSTFIGTLFYATIFGFTLRRRRPVDPK